MSHDVSHLLMRPHVIGDRLKDPGDCIYRRARTCLGNPATPSSQTCAVPVCARNGDPHCSAYAQVACDGGAAPAQAPLLEGLQLRGSDELRGRPSLGFGVLRAAMRTTTGPCPWRDEETVRKGGKAARRKAFVAATAND